MVEFLTGILAFPTVIFTVMLGFAVVYWLFVVVGFFSMDFLDGVMGLEAADGALEGAADAAFEGAAEAAIEGAGEALEGASEAFDGAADGAVDGAAEAADGAESQGGILGFLNALGLRGIPITVTFSFILLGCWVLSFLLMQLVGASVRSSVMLFGVSAGVAVVSFMASVLVSSVVLRPFRRFFAFDHAPQRSSLVGKICTLTTGRVDAKFGQAEIDDGGSGFVAEVRCSKKNSLARGDKALVFRYDSSAEVFHIAPLDEALKKAVR